MLRLVAETVTTTVIKEAKNSNPNDLLVEQERNEFQHHVELLKSLIPDTVNMQAKRIRIGALWELHSLFVRLAFPFGMLRRLFGYLVTFKIIIESESYFGWRDELTKSKLDDEIKSKTFVDLKPFFSNGNWRKGKSF